MWQRAINMIASERTTRTAFLPVRAEHEMVNQQLAPPIKQFAQRDIAIGPLENVILVDFYPWQFPSLSGQFIAQLCFLLFLLQQLLSSGNPLFSGYNFVLTYFIWFITYRGISAHNCLSRWRPNNRLLFFH